MRSVSKGDVMEIVEGRHFENERVDLTGKAWPGCTFKNCTLIWTSGPETDPADSRRLGKNRLEGDGWPLEWFDDYLDHPG